jgi:chorismate mutase
VTPRPLDELRQEIERVDRALIALMAQRHAIAREVGACKRAQGQSVLDPAREAAVVARAGALAREAGLPDDDVRALFRGLIALSRRAQHDS